MDRSQYPCYNPRGVQTDYVCSECPQWNGEMYSETARIKTLEKEGYRIPSIEEFVQGFEFESLRTREFVFMDLGQPICITHDKPYITSAWIPCKVWWKEKPGTWITRTIKKLDGTEIEVTADASVDNFFEPPDDAIQKKIDLGLIRVKIKNDNDGIKK